MGESSKNPHWDRDETLLALDLYLSCKGKVPDKSDDRVVELSNLLRRNPLYDKFSKRENFRSPSAVVLKLNNIRQAAEGRGMPNNSQVDRRLWEEFADAPHEVATLAKSIRLTIQNYRPINAPTTENEYEFREGRLLTRVHKVRERDPTLRRRVLKDRVEKHNLKCEVCHRGFKHLDIEIRRSAFEIHHILPVASSLERTISVKDIAVLCASCHRLIHRLISIRRNWVSIDEARIILGEGPGKRTFAKAEKKS